MRIVDVYSFTQAVQRVTVRARSDDAAETPRKILLSGVTLTQVDGFKSGWHDHEIQERRL
jgi:hypothetical protein